MGLYCLNNRSNPAGFLLLIFLKWTNSSPVHLSMLSLTLATFPLYLLLFGGEGKISQDWLTTQLLSHHLSDTEHLISCQSFIRPPNTISAQVDAHRIWLRQPQWGKRTGPLFLSPIFHLWVWMRSLQPFRSPFLPPQCAPTMTYSLIPSLEDRIQLMLSLGKHEIMSILERIRKGCPKSSFSPTQSVRGSIADSICKEDPSIVDSGEGGEAGRSGKWTKSTNQEDKVRILNVVYRGQISWSQIYLSHSPYLMKATMRLALVWVAWRQLGF